MPLLRYRFFFFLAIIGNLYIVSWYISLKWIWIIFGGFTITILGSLILGGIFAFIINLLKRGNIAPLLLRWMLIPIIIVMSLYSIYHFWEITNFDNGKEVYAFFAFMIMIAFTTGMIIFSIYFNKLSLMDEQE
ncbi:MAG: hypothetical protein UZ11_BCD004000611 [Bacteroidetes bacterium OLB11]|nr:MAG: hypothetical protein UZ11_BCD004000611 [Bacteroidetes bacterium OLB11]